MLYRIDFQHFLTHAIDYFTRDELLHFKYVIISSSVANLSKQQNVTKAIHLYPTTDIILYYEETKDKKLMEKMYLDLLEIKQPEDEWIGEKIYTTFINPIINHQDIVIVCDRGENDYIDVLCSHIKQAYALECIDLNKLFIDGHIGPLRINKDKIWNHAVDIRRMAIKQEIKNMEATRDGRMSLLAKMTTKDKINKLREIGIKVGKDDKDKLDELLVDSWVNEDGEED